MESCCHRDVHDPAAADVSLSSTFVNDSGCACPALIFVDASAFAQGDPEPGERAS